MNKKITYELATSIGYLVIGLEGDDLVISHYHSEDTLESELRVLASRGVMSEINEVLQEIERQVIGE